jgi:hypothetical protein
MMGHLVEELTPKDYGVKRVKPRKGKTASDLKKEREAYVEEMKTKVRETLCLKFRSKVRTQRGTRQISRFHKLGLTDNKAFLDHYRKNSPDNRSKLAIFPFQLLFKIEYQYSVKNKIQQNLITNRAKPDLRTAPTTKTKTKTMISERM